MLVIQALAVQCAGGSVNSLATLQPYIGMSCQVITGPLIISNLPANIGDLLLLSAFQNVTQINGGLSITNNLWLATLDCFQSLKTSGLLYIIGNEGLVDARIPNLSPNTSVVVSSNRRLCPLNYPLAGGVCSVIDLDASFHLSGITAAQFMSPQQTLFERTIAAMVTANISHVCCIVDLTLSSMN